MTQPVARQEDKPARVLSRRIFIIALLIVGIAALAVSALRLVSRQETAVSPEQNVQQGLALNKQQQYDAAIDEFTQAIKARPDMVDAYLYRGIALFGAGRPKDSITDFTRVLELEPERAVVYLYRGDSYLALGQKDQAVINYEHALTLAGADERLATTARTKLYLADGNEP